MKTVYEAANSLEGHMVANLLEQADIYAQVDGEYLQGGVGELQAFGLVKVRVNQPDFDMAKKIITQWEQQHTSNVPAAQSRLGYQHLALAFVLGLIVGFLL